MDNRSPHASLAYARRAVEARKWERMRVLMEGHRASTWPHHDMNGAGIFYITISCLWFTFYLACRPSVAYGSRGRQIGVIDC